MSRLCLTKEMPHTTFFHSFPREITDLDVGDGEARWERGSKLYVPTDKGKQG